MDNNLHAATLMHMARAVALARGETKVVVAINETLDYMRGKAVKYTAAEIEKATIEAFAADFAKLS